MSRRLLATTVLALASATAWLATPSAQQPQTPVFRARTSTVAVTASIKRGNNVVANLTAADFVVTDNGVPQTVEAVAIENVPIDVTLFLDTSGSTAGKFGEMRDDVQAIVKLLRPGDKFRLLTIGDSVNESVPWVNAGATVDVSFNAVGGISLVHDALMFGLLHRVDPVRRHLVVGMTDRQDCGSVISSTLLFELAGRSEAVMHLVDYSGGGGETRYRVRTCTPRARQGGVATIEQAAARTGGGLQTQSRFMRASAIVRAFRTIFDDFRQSYVLRYSPNGVDAKGWHAISVTVPKVKDATVRARQGYYGDGEGK